MSVNSTNGRARNKIFEANPDDWVKHLTVAGKIIADYMSQCKNPDASTRMLLDMYV